LRVLWLLFAILLGCSRAVRPVDFSAEPFAFTASDYPSVVQRWTRESQFYSGPDIRVFATSTYLSWEWREAKVALLTKQEGLSATDAEALLAKERAEFDQWHVFFVKFYTAPARLNDLNRPNSQWRVQLSDDRGGLLTAQTADIKRLSDGTRYLDAATRKLFPYLDEFSLFYVVRFPKKLPSGETLAPAPGGGRLTLQFVSSLRHTDLVWMAQDPEQLPEVSWWRRVF
jgi:hypothetical protein